MIRALTQEEVDQLLPLFFKQVSSSADAHLHQLMFSNERCRNEGLPTTGVFGYFEGDTLKVVTSVLPWGSTHTFTLRAIHGSSGWENIAALIEHAVGYMESQGHYTFMWAKPLTANDVSNKKLKTRIFLTKIPERWEIVVDQYGEMPSDTLSLSFTGGEKKVAVFKATLKNQFRPYTAVL